MAEQQHKLPSGLGALIAVLVIVGTLVLWLAGRLPAEEAALIGGLALARLT